MRSASGGCPRAAQRPQEEDPSVRELHKAEAGNRLENYSKADKQNKGHILSTRRLATVTIHKWITMLKAWFRGNSVPSDAQPLEPHPPRRWPFLMLLLMLFLVLLVASIGSNSWLRPWIQLKPSMNSDDEIAILLKKYGLATNKTEFGDTLVPTLWMQMHSPLGPDIYKLQRAIQILDCSKITDMQTISVADAPTTNMTDLISEQCPSYFYWIREDLAPWKEMSGISRTTLEMTKKHAAFRAIILKGKLYVELYRSCYQSRVLYTLWGLLLLLEKYKNRVPDLDIMFNCGDQPRIRVDAKMSLPLFGYCSNRDYYDIPWPDWTFWGWSEIQLESWDQEFDKIVRNSKKKSWKHKIKKAYWRGNPFVKKYTKSELADRRYKVLSYREQLPFCHNTTKNPRMDVVTQKWDEEVANGKQNSKLEDQCTHRYMMYVEGVTWSASLKYIMACGSPTMVISPSFYDFFSRGLQPGVHYIRVEPRNSCVSNVCSTINDKVEEAEWNHLKAEQIGKTGQAFMGKEVGMNNVYDYMFHMLNEYAKLLTFKPKKSDSAHLVTQDYIMCLALPIQRLLLRQARKLMPHSVAPCSMSKHPTGFKDFGWEAYKKFDKTC